MCGRFRAGWGAIKRLRHYGEYEKAAAAIRELLYGTRFNISPTQDVLAVRLSSAESVAGEREFFAARWGLVPFWSQEPKVPYSTFNAKVETVATAPAYREAFKRRRCLVLADGWYEWRRDPEGGKQPYMIQLVSGEPFCFAGLWERWTSKTTGEVVESCTIITGPASIYVAQVHDRMPLVLPEADCQAWLGPEADERGRGLQILAGAGRDQVVAVPVSKAVGNARAQGAELARAVGEALR